MPRLPQPTARYELTSDGEPVRRAAWHGTLEVEAGHRSGAAWIPFIQVECGVWRGEHNGKAYEIRPIDPDWLPLGDRALATCLNGPCEGQVYHVSTQTKPGTVCEDCGPEGWCYQAIHGEAGEWYLLWLDKIPTMRERLRTGYYDKWPAENK